MPSSTKDIREIRICTFNIAKNFRDLDVFLERNVNDFDVLFIQEPPWQLIRHAPSAVSREGTEVRGAPKHPQWITMVRQPEEGSRPRVLTYVSQRLAPMRPAYRRELIDDRDVMVVSLYVGSDPIYLMNVYSDDQHRGIELIAGRIESLPQMAIMAGDFNCHSSEWDPAVQHHRTTPILLVDTAARLGLEYAPPSNPGPTFVSRADPNVRSVIDLMFLPPGDVIASAPERATNLQGESDHVPLTTLLPLDQVTRQHKGRTIKGGSDEEAAFIFQINTGLADLLHDLGPLDTPEAVEELAQNIAGMFSGAWQVHSKGYTITVKSKPWWGETCQAAYDEYREDKSPDTRRVFRAAVRAAKREFFDEKVAEISIDHKRPWDLMAWIQERKNPPCEAIQFNGQPCHTTDQLWQALHGTYNAANNRPVDLSILDDLPTLAAREWPEFSELELRQALEACSSRSAPGPDHVTWRHLKAILSIPDCTVLILRLANACIDVGHWPKHFKDSLSVIIPKPNKPAYSTPKAFRPIVLLNTLGKLLEKLISNRFQFDMIKYDLVDPNQMGGVRQRSTEDAGLFLTHLVRTGWVKGYHTSVVAFDIAQFFPSINHQFLLAVLRKQGFHPKVATFFASYLVQRFTRYAWNNFVSEPMQADVGVGQGSALSPVLSALVVAPIMKLYRIKEVGLGTTLITFVDDGTIAAQTDSIEMNFTHTRSSMHSSPPPAL
ncbi:hypothetical protein NMY22_g11892 [Coprinellus aureogranulatus]|nr:hypothetical protein NMY22_g11892 [Coprinellus aureogranulatus]